MQAYRQPGTSRPARNASRQDCVPSIARRRWFPAGHKFAFHAHDATQLIYAKTGTLSGRLARHAFSVPPGHGFLVSPDVGHSLICATGDLEVRDVRFDANLLGSGIDARLVKISPLAREIVDFLVDTPADDWDTPVVVRTASLLLEHLDAVSGPWLHCPLPRDRRLLRIAQHLLEQPDDMTTLDEWAGRVGASVRTLGRLFSEETGLTFGEWRARAKLMEAVRRLEGGAAIYCVAADLGYDSPSAFSQMFKRHTGSAPSRYLARQQSIT